MAISPSVFRSQSMSAICLKRWDYAVYKSRLLLLLLFSVETNRKRTNKQTGRQTWGLVVVFFYCATSDTVNGDTRPLTVDMASMFLHLLPINLVARGARQAKTLPKSWVSKKTDSRFSPVTCFKSLMHRIFRFTAPEDPVHVYMGVEEGGSGVRRSMCDWRDTGLKHPLFVCSKQNTVLITQSGVLDEILLWLFCINFFSSLSFCSLRMVNEVWILQRL